MRYPWQTMLAGFTLAGLLAVPATGQTVQVVVNERPVRFSDQAPIQREGRVYIPLRGVLDRMGAETIQWRPSREEVFVARGPREILLQIGDRSAQVDGQRVFLDAPPILVNGRTMVPLRFVSENLGATVRWEGYTRTVYISSPGERVAGRRETLPDDEGRIPDARPRPNRPRDRGMPLVIQPLRPIPGEAVSSRRPEITATVRSRGAGDIDHDAIRMRVDGGDVTRELELGVNSVTYRPMEDLERGLHRVQLTVRDRQGNAVTRDWTFQVR
jgi:hypothetical protein